MKTKQNEDVILFPIPNCSNIRIKSKNDSLLGATSLQKLKEIFEDENARYNNVKNPRNIIHHIFIFSFFKFNYSYSISL